MDERSKHLNNFLTYVQDVFGGVDARCVCVWHFYCVRIRSFDRFEWMHAFCEWTRYSVCFSTGTNTTLYVRSIWMCVAQWWWRWLFVFILLVEPYQIEIYIQNERWEKKKNKWNVCDLLHLATHMNLLSKTRTNEKNKISASLATLFSSSPSSHLVRRSACALLCFFCGTVTCWSYIFLYEMQIVRTRACSPNDKYAKQINKNGERRNRKEKKHTYCVYTK